LKLINFLYLVIGVIVIYTSTFVSVEIKGIGVPITGQSLVVLIIAYLLPKNWGVFAVITYVIIGMLGLPVFADGASGMETIIGNSGGYIYGFIFSALVILWFRKFKNAYSFKFILLGMLLGTLVILLFGFLHLSYRIGCNNAFVYGVQPFIIGGFIKIILGAFFVWFWNKNTFIQRFIKRITMRKNHYPKK